MTPQWCELGRHVVRTVDPVSFDGKRKFMACPKCLRAFRRVKAHWGYKSFWRLMTSVPQADLSGAGLRPYTLKVSDEDEVIRLRARGWRVECQIESKNVSEG